MSLNPREDRWLPWNRIRPYYAATLSVLVHYFLNKSSINQGRVRLEFLVGSLDAACNVARRSVLVDQHAQDCVLKAFIACPIFPLLSSNTHNQIKMLPKRRLASFLHY